MKRLAFFLALLFLLPGCSWFLLSGVAALYVVVDDQMTEEDEPATPPAVAFSAPARLTANPATLNYTVYDAEADPCDVLVEYSVAGGSFHPAVAGTGGDSVSGLSSTPEGVSHAFVWDFSSGLDLTSPETLDVTIRITVTDGTGRSSAALSSGHSLGNAQPEIDSITLPAGTFSGTVTIEYVIRDTHGDPGQIEIEFKREADGSDWAAYGQPATADASDPQFVTHNRGTSPTGVTHVFPWQSNTATDMPDEDGDVKIRIRASDDGGTTWSSWQESATTLAVENNGVPHITIDSVRPDPSGLVYVHYTAADDNDHAVSVMAEYRYVEDATWRRATAGPGTTSLTVIAASTGTTGIFTWDSKKDGIAGKRVVLRLVPSEAGLLGGAASQVLAVANDDTTAWATRASLSAPRRLFDAVALAGKIYVVGGVETAGSVTKVERFDPATDTWQTMADLPVAGDDVRCAAVEGKLYAFRGGSGGWAGMYDPETDTWTPITAPTFSRTDYGIAACRGLIYLVGGFFWSPTPGVDTYDPVTDSYQSIAGLPGAMGSATCATLEGKVHAMMGTIHYVFDPGAGSWSNGASLPTTRVRFAACSTGGRMFVFGGNASVDEYDASLNRWATRASLTQARSDLAAAPMDGKIYVFGGRDSSIHLALVEEFDPPAANWESGQDMTNWRSCLALVETGGLVFAVGGYRGTQLPDLEAYDPGTDQWTALSPMATARSYGGAAALGGKVYAFGGEDASYAATATAEEYDVSTGNWSAIASMNQAREAPGHAAHEGRIYAIGGYDGSDFLASAEVFDPSTGGWSAIADLPTAKAWMGTAALGGGIYAIGGRNAERDVAFYDPRADMWQTKSNLPEDFFFGGCATLDGRIYIMGSGDSSSYFNLTNTVYMYEPQQDRWIKVLSMPMARRAFGCTGFGGEIFVAGGLLSNGSTGTVSLLRGHFSRIPICTILTDLPESTSNVSLGVSEKGAHLAGGSVTAGVSSDARTLPLVENMPALGPFSISRDWADRSGLPAERTGSRAVSYGDTVYVAGGFDGSGMAQSDLVSFSPSTNAWDTGLSGMSVARAKMGLVRIGDVLLALGGTDGTSSLASAESYDTGTGIWSGLSAMGTARSNFACAACGGRVFVFGGEDVATSTQLDTVEMFDVISGSWTSLGSLLPYGMAGGAAVTEGDRIVLLGGKRTHGSGATVDSDMIYFFDTVRQTLTLTDTVLPCPLSEAGLGDGSVTWGHRGISQTDRFVILAGGSTGSVSKKTVMRFTSR